MRHPEGGIFDFPGLFKRRLGQTPADAASSTVEIDECGNHGHVIASSVKPLIYKNSSRPVFTHPMEGKPWNAGKIKPDPTTQIKSVHVGVPVLDGGKVIGVLHAGVSVE